MNVKCPCGGLFIRADIEGRYSREYRRVIYLDTDPKVATWKCNKCKAIRTQRKRQKEGR
jgi:hypothetical protein